MGHQDFLLSSPLKPAPELHANRRRRQSSGKSLSARLLQPGRNTRLQGNRKKAGDLRHDVLHANAHAGKRFSLLVPVFAASLPGPSVRRKDAPSVPPFCAIKHKKPPWKRGLFSGGKDQFSHFPFTYRGSSVSLRTFTQRDLPLAASLRVLPSLSNVSSS